MTDTSQPPNRLGAARAAAIRGSRLARLCAAVALMCALAACNSESSQSPADRPRESGGDVGRESSVSAGSDCETAFVLAMIPHHEQALEMGRLASDRAGDPRVVQAASRMSVAQRREIAAMAGWLAERGMRPSPSADGSSGGHAHHDAMPGMLTKPQLQQLASLSGRAFDRSFLRLMTYHHRGAITMAEEVLPATPGPSVRLLAMDATLVQRAEIVQMQRLLAELRTGRPLGNAELARMMALRGLADPLPVSVLPECGG